MTALYGSLTAADPAALGDAASRLAAAGVDGLHLDVADGVFVPSLTFGPALVAALRRRLPDTVLDVHLMVACPEALFEELAAAGASRVAFHAEATRYPWRAVTLARRAGLPTVGVALNPASPLELLDSVRHDVAFVNLLTTEPDCAGEQLLPASFERVPALRDLLGPETTILADGGVNAGNARRLVALGTTEVVVGRGITGAGDWSEAVLRLREALG